MNNMRTSTIVLTVLLVGVTVSFVYCLIRDHQLGLLDKSTCDKKYSFINPDLTCDVKIADQTLSLKNKVQDKINYIISSKKAERVSVLYRNLKTSQWFGINENDSFTPGSLLKLPLTVAYYKLAEADKSILDQQFKYTPPQVDNFYSIQHTKPTVELEKDKVYTVSDLIEHMIQYSDNAVVPVLAANIEQGVYTRTYVDLGVFIPTSGGLEQDFLTVKTYANILRTLYNASYLNQYYSNELLTIMSRSSFRSGIAGGLSGDTKVANKFGEKIVVEQGTNKVLKTELHDCGIIYKTNNPYILCVMTQGDSYDELEKVLSDVSKTVYNNL